ncbi:MAG: non-ribosomal peptide synthetase [Micromonosporaceae bacterium]
MSELAKRLARLPGERRAELLALLREEAATTGPGPVPTRRERGATIPLSEGQASLWIVGRFNPDQPTYNLVVRVRLTGPLDVDTWRRAMGLVVARHDMLRTSIADGPDGPEQRTQASVPVEIPVIDMPGATAEHRRVAADEHTAQLGRQVFDLERAPLWRAALLRTDTDDHHFVYVAHHVVVDGWSWGIVFAELTAAYTALMSGVEPAFAEKNLEFGDYVLWLRDWLADGNLDELTRFWRERLNGLPVLDFPTDHPRPPVQSFKGGSRYRTLSVAQSEVAAVARALHTTTNVIYTAVYVALLHRYTGSEDVVIGQPTANRDFTEVEPLVGYFLNMLVLRVDLSGAPTFRTLAARVQERALEAFAHGALPITRLVEAVGADRDPSRSPVFQHVFAFQNAEQEFSLPGLVTERLSAANGTCRYDIAWELTERAVGTELIARYATDLFDEATVDDLMTRYELMLRAVVANPDLALAQIPLLDATERREMLERWNGPVRPAPEGTVPELFAAQVQRRAGAVAVTAAGETLTYAELDRRADELAHRLRDAGAEPGKLVALCLPRRVELVVAMLAAMKAGAAYVPLDPAHPSARLATILDDAEPVAIVTMALAGENLPDTDVPVIRLNGAQAAAPAGALPPSAGPHDPAYVLFTSGSTGTPKGVVIEHHSVVNFVAAMQEQFEVTDDDCLLGFAAATFDVSVFEIFTPLLSGCRLYLATDDERLDIDGLQDLLIRNHVTITDLPPSVMTLLEPAELPELRSVFVGLEAYPGELVNRWNKGRRFFNGYGPTECTVSMVGHECTGEWQTSPPIGLPIVNHVAHVLDAAGEPVPVGMPGELVIGGTGLARGYLNRPELTAEKFYPDPFGTSPGGMLYRTGDLAKRRPDGVLVFLGRVDHQVKIRGLRIELGEIESVLSRHPGVDQVAVDVRGEKQLVCYLGGPLAPPDAATLRTFLADRLPAYMIPAQYVTLPVLPLNSSGKVDRGQLPDPPEVVRDSDAPVHYASEVERTIATEIVAPLIGRAPESVEPERNFFEMGGHSLAAARMLARVRTRFGAEIGLADFFRAPTVRGLAELVDVRRAALAAEDEVLAMLESMTDEEAAVLLAAEPGAPGGVNR